MNGLLHKLFADRRKRVGCWMDRADMIRQRAIYGACATAQIRKKDPDNAPL